MLLIRKLFILEIEREREKSKEETRREFDGEDVMLRRRKICRKGRRKRCWGGREKRRTRCRKGQGRGGEERDDIIYTAVWLIVFIIPVTVVCWSGLRYSHQQNVPSPSQIMLTAMLLGMSLNLILCVGVKESLGTS